MLQDSATPKMVRNVIDGTTPPQKVVGSYEQLEDGTYNLIIGLTGDAPSAAAISQINGEEIKLGGGAKLAEHPIGSLWISSDATSPAAIMGGSWERVQDVFPLFAGTTYAANSTGGEAVHDHLYGVRKQSWNNVVTGSSNQSICVKEYRNDSFPASNSIGSVNDYTNGALTNNTPLSSVDQGYSEGHTGQAETLPPYRTFYCWERVA